MRVAERRQVFQLETLTALDDATHQLYLAAHQHYAHHAIERRPSTGLVPVRGVPAPIREPADLVAALTERVLDDDARTRLRAFRDTTLDLVTTQRVDNPEDRMPGYAEQSRDLYMRLGLLTRALFEG